MLTKNAVRSEFIGLFSFSNVKNVKFTFINALFLSKVIMLTDSDVTLRYYSLSAEPRIYYNMIDLIDIEGF